MEIEVLSNPACKNDIDFQPRTDKNKETIGLYTLSLKGD